MVSDLYNQVSALLWMFAGGQPLAYNHGGPVLSQITLRHLHGGLSGSEVGFTPLSHTTTIPPLLCANIYHSSLMCAINLARQYIITSSTFKLGALPPTIHLAGERVGKLHVKLTFPLLSWKLEDWQPSLRRSSPSAHRRYNEHWLLNSVKISVFRDVTILVWSKAINVSEEFVPSIFSAGEQGEREEGADSWRPSTRSGRNQYIYT